VNIGPVLKDRIPRFIEAAKHSSLAAELIPHMIKPSDELDLEKDDLAFYLRTKVDLRELAESLKETAVSIEQQLAVLP
jgi:hypothetical protein